MEDGQPGTKHARRRSASVAQLLGGEPQSGISSIGGASTGHAHGLKDDEERDQGKGYAATSTRDSSSDWEMNEMLSDDNLDDDEETGLTNGDKKRRGHRERRNTLLDERIANSDDAKALEEKIAVQSFWRKATINGVLIALWYTFSISISVFNKWVLSKDNVDFHFPLFFTSFHMIIQFCLAGLVLYFVPSFRPKASDANTEEHRYAQVGQSDNTTSEQPKKPIMTKLFYLTRIAPCGAATGLDIGLGNMSLMFISLTFYTMCKSSVLGFVLAFAFLFRLEKPSWKIAAVIFTMAVGVVLMVAGETAFNVLGFVLIMAASFFSGFRWSLTQILLLRNPATSNPFSSIFFIAPVMFFTLLIIAFPVEGAGNFVAGVHRLVEARGHALAVAILMFPGLLAFLMTAAEFALLKRTSVVTLSVCGIFKEVLTISTGALVFGDKLTPVNLSGLLVTISSIAAYNYMKINQMRQSSKREAAEQTKAEDPVLDTSDRQNDGFEDGVRRNSTHNMIRNSLSVQANGGDRSKRGDERPTPPKRPEDLD
ncbi:hypothetical protein MBLNU457_2321t1 [Dothideomycetes sp. NU457]